MLNCVWSVFLSSFSALKLHTVSHRMDLNAAPHPHKELKLQITLKDMTVHKPEEKE